MVDVMVDIIKELLTVVRLDSDWAKLTALFLGCLMVVIVWASRYRLEDSSLFGLIAHKIGTRQRIRAVDKCHHAWVLYTHSRYSVCCHCQAGIDTAKLLYVLSSFERLSEPTPDHPPPWIIGRVEGVALSIGKGGMVVTQDWVGKGGRRIN